MVVSSHFDASSRGCWGHPGFYEFSSRFPLFFLFRHRCSMSLSELVATQFPGARLPHVSFSHPWVKRTVYESQCDIVCVANSCWRTRYGFNRTVGLLRDWQNSLIGSRKRLTKSVKFESTGIVARGVGLVGFVLNRISLESGTVLFFKTWLQIAPKITLPPDFHQRLGKKIPRPLKRYRWSFLLVKTCVRELTKILGSVWIYWCILFKTS